MASTARRRAAKLKRMALLVEAGVFADGEDVSVLDESEHDVLESAFRNQTTREASNSGGAGGGGTSGGKSGERGTGGGGGSGKNGISGGGGCGGKLQAEGLGGSGSDMVPTWSASMFDLEAFPQVGHCELDDGGGGGGSDWRK